jgi:hypothetical protein
MWQSLTVERALFRWQKWRNSIIDYWVKHSNELNGSFSPAESEVCQELMELGLPDLDILEIYWICCVFSDFNLDYPVTFEKIITPEGLQIHGHEIKPGNRAYPPCVIDEGDLKFEARQYGLRVDTLKDLYSASHSYNMLLQSSHELLHVLSRIRGRPKRHGRHGRLPKYYDRLALQCAVLKDLYEMSYVQIAERFRLDVTRPFSSRQSDTTVHLVDRGRKILRDNSYEFQ